LKHDVGKALRWSAPEVRETDPEALRARLASDLLPSGDRAAKRDVVQSFFEWKREEGELFDTHDDDLSAVTGDTDDEARLLEIAAKETPELLSPAERLVFARQAEARRDRRCGDGCLGSRGCRTGRRSHRSSR
jgi:hypothetical protein